MAISISDLTVTEGYADGTILTFAQLAAAMTSIETHSNTKLVNNLEQLALDCFPTASYTFTDNSTKAITSTLWDKQFVEDEYDGGDISIGTSADAGWANVDGTNISVAITPEMAGKYKATFTFTHEATSTATTLMAVEVGFRITDGTDASQPMNSGATLAATGSGSSVFQHPITIVYVFDFTTTTAKTITLQKWVRTATAVSANTVNASSSSGGVYMCVEKI